MARPAEHIIRRVQIELRNAGRPSTWQDACAELGKRGARRRQMRRESSLKPVTTGRSCLPPGDRD